MTRTNLLAALLWFCSSASVDGYEHDHGKRQLSFIENKGHWPVPVLFRSEVIGASIFMERDGISWVKMENGAFDRLLSADELSNEEQADLLVKGHAWRVRFVDPNPDLTLNAINQYDGEFGMGTLAYFAAGFAGGFLAGSGLAPANYPVKDSSPR